MPSQLELLKKALVESEARSGPDNPFVKGLKAQIARFEKPPAENPVEMFSIGMRSSQNSAHTETEKETERDGIRAEALRRLKVRQLSKNQPSRTRDSLK